MTHHVTAIFSEPHAAERAVRLITVHRLQNMPLTHASTRNERVRLQKAWRAWWAANEEAVRQRLGQPKRP